MRRRGNVLVLAAVAVLFTLPDSVPARAQHRRTRPAGVIGVLRGHTIRRLPAVRRRPVRPRIAASTLKKDPSLRLLVKEYVPRSATAPPPSPPRWRRRYYYRPTQPVQIKSSPNGQDLARVTLACLVKVLHCKGDHCKVRTQGHAEVTGYLPKDVLGLRVLTKSNLLGSPSAKDVVGAVQGGMLVRVISTRGRFTKVELMGQTPIELWMKSADLGVGSASTAGWTYRYPGGHYMSLKTGPIHASPNGRVVARAPDFGRIYRVTTKGKWSKVAVAAYRFIHFIGWVPTKQVQYGYYGTYTGSGYRVHSSDYSSGSMVAVVRVPVYLALDDAYPTAYIKAGARFNVSDVDARWVLVRFSGTLYFTGYLPRRLGFWVPVSSYNWRR